MPKVKTSSLRFQLESSVEGDVLYFSETSSQIVKATIANMNAARKEGEIEKSTITTVVEAIKRGRKKADREFIDLIEVRVFERDSKAHIKAKNELKNN